MGMLAGALRGLTGRATPGRAERLAVYQYWDEPAPPADVAANLQAMREAVAGCDWTLLDEQSATRLIRRRCNERKAAAFRACKPPAMQADYLRLCLMDAFGGVYLDADHRPLRPLAPLLAGAGATLLPIWHNIVGTDTMMFRAPGHPFVRACLTLATENIEHRRFDSVLMATGPAVLTAMRCAGDNELERQVQALVECSSWNRDHWALLVDRAAALKAADPAISASLAAITFVPVEEMGSWVRSPLLAYKSTSRHWLNWSESLYG